MKQKELQKCVNEMAQTIKIKCFEKCRLQFNVGRVTISFGTSVMNENKWGLSREGRTLDRMCKSQIENLQNT